MAKDPGPFSSLLDYEKEDELLRQRKEQQQASQQKIMKTNALGEAFRIIADAIGGSQGATIAPRAVNAGIVNAADRMRGEEDKYNASRDRLRLQSLDLAAKDKGYELDQEAARAAERFKAGEAEKDRGYKTTQAGVEHLNKIEEIEAGNKGRLAEQELQNKGALNLEYARTKGDLQQIEARKSATKALAEKGLFEVSRYDSPATDAIINRNQVVGMLNDLKVYLRQKGVFPTQMPKVLQNTDTRGKISDDDLKFLIGTYKEFFQPRLPELTGGSPADGAMPGEASDKQVLQMLVGSPAPNNVGYAQGQGPLRNPAIQPAQAVQQPAQNTLNLKETDISSIDNVLNAPNYTREQKRSAVWSYLLKQGYPDDYARKFAEYAYSQLN